LEGEQAMASIAMARALALALDGAEERDHHGRPSFRVGGRIFATLWDAGHMNVMVGEEGIRTYVARDGEVWWGKRLAAVRVALECVGESELAELLADAWEHNAPARLVAERRAGGGRRAAGGGRRALLAYAL
jgi:hypothetical protein